MFALILMFQLGTSQGNQIEADESSPKPKFKSGFSYAYGPEVGLLLFPPIKVNVDYYYNKSRNLYIGLDGTINVFIAIWGHVGFQTGFQLRNAYVESGLDLTYFEVGNYLSFNPKMGYDISLYKNVVNLYLEAGPSFRLRSNENISELRYLKIGGIPLNLEIGFNGRF